MRISRTTILAGAAALLVAGAAEAATANFHRMNVALPDGSVAHIQYLGDVAPRVTVEPVDAPTAIAFDPFADFDRIAAAMDAQRQAMMQQVAELERAAAQAATAAPGQVTVAGNLPAGVHVTYVSSTTDANGCTQTVEYSSDGSSNAAPKVTRTSAGSCDAAKPGMAAPIAASATAPAAPQAPAAKA